MGAVPVYNEFDRSLAVISNADAIDLYRVFVYGDKIIDIL